MKAMCSFRYNELVRKLPEVPAQCKGGECAQFYPQFIKTERCEKWDREEIAEKCLWYWRYYKLKISNDGLCIPTGRCSDRCYKKPVYTHTKPVYFALEQPLPIPQNFEVIKIGETYDIKQRWGNSKSSNPREIEVLGTVEGIKERDVKNHFTDYKIYPNSRDEWFFLTREMVETYLMEHRGHFQ